MLFPVYDNLIIFLRFTFSHTCHDNLDTLENSFLGGQSVRSLKSFLIDISCFDYKAYYIAPG